MTSRAIPQTSAASSPKPSPARVRAVPSAAVTGARGEPDSAGALISQRRDPVDRLADHGLALVAVDLVGEEQPVGEDGGSERLDVVGQDVVTALERGERLGGAEEHQPGTGARAELDALVLPGGLADGDHVLAQRLGPVDAGEGGL